MMNNDVERERLGKLRSLFCEFISSNNVKEWEIFTLATEIIERPFLRRFADVEFKGFLDDWYEFYKERLKEVMEKDDA